MALNDVQNSVRTSRVSWTVYSWTANNAIKRSCNLFLITHQPPRSQLATFIVPGTLNR